MRAALIGVSTSGYDTYTDLVTQMLRYYILLLSV